MFESVVAHITKAGYDLINQVIAGEVDSSAFKIQKIAFSGATSPVALTPYTPSVLDEDIPNHIIEIPADNITGFRDPTDGCLVLRVTVDSSLFVGYLNGVGVFINDILFAANSLMIAHVQTGNSITFDIKIPFLPSELITATINLDTGENAPSRLILENFETSAYMKLIPIGFSGVFFDYTSATDVLWSTLNIKVESDADLQISYIGTAATDVNTDMVIFASNVVLSKTGIPEIDFVIPVMYKELVIACDSSASEVYYSLELKGVRRVN